MTNPVRWFEIYVRDMPRAKKFYEGVFQAALTRLGDTPGLEMWSFPMEQAAPGCAGALVKVDGFDPGNNSVVVYFGSADCAVEEARVERCGGKVFKPKRSIGPYGFISLVVDPEGNLIGIHSVA